ncbi:metallophosphoesterase family protein [Marinobacterium aestuariivivens]|uniref:Metallophosphoesterase family protein n=1 Tax=Marinobacterium aestuariivivens TaxID=1698799 RepID=A0ABW2A609_9GAMM
MNNVDPKLGRKLFSMVVMADTHLNQGEDTCSSPFEVNRLANKRMRYVVRDVNRIAPDFVINLGDLIHPVPSLPSYGEAARQFLHQTRALNCPQYLVPGNHDVGDKPINWGPAGVVCDDYLDLWKEFFGDHYYAFEHQGCHFIVINAQLINSGLADETRQREWLEAYLAEHPGARFFINTHYPPYMTERDEVEHYDNIAEPGRSWLLSLLEQHRVEALFAGHVHNFWYHRHQDTDCYLLPSTAFVRQDYSEMYRIEPGDQGGRNDLPKLGYFVVNVYERGHACLMQRTYGEALEPDAAVGMTQPRVTPLHTVENTRAPLGFDMRQPWAELVEIPPSGALDEFSRKRVRNDYPLLALWEMGVRKMRLPLDDLTSTEVVERIATLRRFGHEFQVFGFEVPQGRQLLALVEHQDLLSGCELAFADADLERVADALRSLKRDLRLPLYLSRLRTREDIESGGSKYYHVINHGYTSEDGSRIRTSITEGPLRGLVDGLVFRLDPGMESAPTLAAIDELCRTLQLQASIHLRVSDASPADVRDDDLDLANRIAETLCAALAHPALGVYVDTFADVDRGFFRRNGVTDRRANPRLAFHVVKHLYAALNADPAELRPAGIDAADGWRRILLTADRKRYQLLLPQPGCMPMQSVAECTGVAFRLLDLASGRYHPVDRHSGRLHWACQATGPVLLEETQS